MGRLLGLSWYDICTRGHGVINILWQELVEGGGIGKPPNGVLYGTKDSSPLRGAQRSQRSREVVASLPTQGDSLPRPLKEGLECDPFMSRWSDATVEVMIPIGGGPTCRDTNLGHQIQGCVGAYSIEKWTTGGHGCMVVYCSVWDCFVE